MPALRPIETAAAAILLIAYAASFLSDFAFDLSFIW